MQNFLIFSGGAAYELAMLVENLWFSRKLEGVALGVARQK